jgi:hypothetical protein
MTVEEKLSLRRKYVLAAFIMMCAIPLLSMLMLWFGVDPSPANGIFSTSAATFSALIIAHFATTPKETK